jgi:hypothetical protein
MVIVSMFDATGEARLEKWDGCQEFRDVSGAIPAWKKSTEDAFSKSRPSRDTSRPYDLLGNMVYQLMPVTCERKHEVDLC